MITHLPQLKALDVATFNDVLSECQDLRSQCNILDYATSSRPPAPARR
jgi:hypothetical protein